MGQVFGGRLVDVLAEVVEGFTLESPVGSGVRSSVAEYTGGIVARQSKDGLMRVASTQSEELDSSIVVELMRPRNERMDSTANLPSIMCRVLSVRAASTCPCAARRRKVEALV